VFFAKCCYYFVALWTFFCVLDLLVAENGKFSRKYFKFKCTISWFLNLLLVKEKVKKNLSPSILPKTIVIKSSMGFSHSNSLSEIIWLLTSNAYIFEHRLQFINGFIVATTLDIIVILKKIVCSSNLRPSNKGRIKTWLGPMFIPWQ
jgi:hypothetical protein